MQVRCKTELESALADAHVRIGGFESERARLVEEVRASIVVVVSEYSRLGCVMWFWQGAAASRRAREEERESASRASMRARSQGFCGGNSVDTD